MEDNQIRSGLLQAGWQTSDVEEAMVSKENPKSQILNPKQSPKILNSKPIIRNSLFIILALGIVVAVYAGAAYYLTNFQNFPLWPFEAPVVSLPTFTPRPSQSPLNQAEGKFCGGIAAVACPIGYECILDGNYPDAGGKCTKADISDWQTYRNEEYGFEFKYPGDWEVGQAVRAVVELSKYEQGNEPRPIFINFQIEDNDRNLTIKDWLDQFDKFDDGYYSSQEIKEIASEQIPGFAQEREPYVDSVKSWEQYVGMEGGWVKYIFVPKANKIYVIYITSQIDLSIFKRELDEFDQILSTFRFIGQIKLKIPPAGFNWQYTENVYTPGTFIYSDNIGYLGNIIDFKGKKWVFESPEANLTIFPNDKIMAQNGWLKEINREEFQIKSSDADLMTFKDYEYVEYLKLENSKLSSIVFRKDINFHGPHDRYTGYNCPCDYEYTVFLGDPVDVDLLHVQILESLRNHD